MIYTCYDMVRDCRADRAAGWRYFISQYVPVIRRILAHYFPSSSGENLTERVLMALKQPQGSLFASAEPAPERWFVAELRQQVLAVAGPEEQALDAGLDLEVLGRALEGFTLVEKQAVWLETMCFTAEGVGRLLRMDPRTIEKIRARAAERIRAQMDAWSRSALADSGRRLAREAGLLAGSECLPAKAFLDVLDGRATWSGREEMDRHVIACWNCIDHFCRLVEVLELVRGLQPLPESEAQRLQKLLGVDTPRQARWSRLLGLAR